MSRSASSIARRAALLFAACLAGACEGPPAVSGPTDGQGPLDAHPRRDAYPRIADAAPALTDARVAVDAGPPDSRPPDAAPDADPGTVNPNGIHFTDVTESSLGGLLPAGQASGDLWGLGAGAAIGDLDGDGRPDVVFARVGLSMTMSPGGPAGFFRNVTLPGGAMALREDPAFSALTAGLAAHGVAIGDFDGDGDLDVFLACEGPDHLLENDGAGHFVDVTDQAGVAGPPDEDSTIGAVFADFNDDGLLDLYVLNYARAFPPLPVPAAKNRLFLNLGDGRFQDVSALSRTDTDGASEAAAAVDLDGDGVLDLYVGNDAFAVDGQGGGAYPRDALYVRSRVDEQGVPIYANLDALRGLSANRSTMGMGIADFDGDGWLDLYLTDWGTKDLYTYRPATGDYVDRARDFGVELRSDASGLLLVSWGALPLDLDRDGAHELFVVNGSVDAAGTGAFEYHQLDVFLRQLTVGGAFTDITGIVGLPTVPLVGGKSRAVGGRGVFAGDLDGDGDDDLIVGPIAESFRVYRTDVKRHGHYVRLRLVGTVSAPDPAGALVTVVGDDGKTARAPRIAGMETYGQSDAVVELGLGAARPTSVSVRWPSGYVQRVDPVAATDGELRVVEPRWLTVTPRVAAVGDSAPRLTYVAVDDTGAPLGAQGAGRTVTVVRSDDMPVTVVDRGDGTYSASLPHPGSARRTTVAITVDGAPVGTHPMIVYR